MGGVLSENHHFVLVQVELEAVGFHPGGYLGHAGDEVVPCHWCFVRE